jgi:putative nucleotidyltransferase with HDIG domain
MTPSRITQAQVLGTKHELPVFPKVVLQILETLEDPDTCLTVLAQHIEHEPVIAASVLSLANRAGTHSHGGSSTTDVFTAVSLVGLSRVREVAILASLRGFVKGLAPVDALESFWAHSLASAVCGVEVARQASAEVGMDAALIACLLHDVGQLWLRRFEPQRHQVALLMATPRGVAIDTAERNLFGTDHGVIGGWLAQSWGLPQGIVKSITHHHMPESALEEPLVAVAHVSDVLSNALDLAHSPDSKVLWLSHASCAALGLTWGPESQQLFGQIEARSRRAFASLGA